METELQEIALQPVWKELEKENDQLHKDRGVGVGVSAEDRL